jgi:hypothetical protein
MAHAGAVIILAFAFCCLFVATASVQRPVDLPRQLPEAIDRETAAEKLVLKPLADTEVANQQAIVYAVLEEESTRRPPHTPSLCTKTRMKAAPSTSCVVEPAIAVEPVVAKKLGGGGWPRLAATKLCHCLQQSLKSNSMPALERGPLALNPATKERIESHWNLGRSPWEQSLRQRKPLVQGKME